MATDRGKKKPAPKRRPTPKVAGRSADPQDRTDQTPDPTATDKRGVDITKRGDAPAPLPPEVRGAKAAGPSERSESRSTSLEGPGDDAADADTVDTEKATEPESTDPESTDPEPTKPEVTKPEVTKPKTKPVARVSTLRRGDAPVPGTAQDEPSRPMGRRPGRQRGRRGRGASRNPLGIRTGVLAAVAAVLFVVAAVLAFHPGAEIGPNKAFVDRESTSQLTSQAQERICAVFGYDHTELDEWQRRAQDALTGQARTEFDETLNAQRELITQTKTGAECRVDAIGVRDLSGGGDGATASVIANLVVSETQNSMATNSGAPRAQFAMVREGDQWRIRAVEPF